MAIVNVPIRTPMYDAGGILSRVWEVFFQSVGSTRAGIQFLSGAHAARLATSANVVLPGSTYLETDRGITYRSTGTAWVYGSGTMRDVLANLPALTAGDAGFLFFATDFVHTFRWDGAAWGRAPGDPPSALIELFVVAPGAGWKLADGTANPVTYSTALAVTATVTLPDFRGVYLKGAAAYTGSLLAAIAAGLTGAVAPEAAHTHPPGTLVNSAPSNTVLVSTTTTTSSVSGSAHTHTILGATGAGASHTHALGTLANDTTAEPAHVELMPYFRL